MCYTQIMYILFIVDINYICAVWCLILVAFTHICATTMINITYNIVFFLKFITDIVVIIL